MNPAEPYAAKTRSAPGARASTRAAHAGYAAATSVGDAFAATPFAVYATARTPTLTTAAPASTRDPVTRWRAACAARREGNLRPTSAAIAIHAGVTRATQIKMLRTASNA